MKFEVTFMNNKKLITTNQYLKLNYPAVLFDFYETHIQGWYLDIWKKKNKNLYLYSFKIIK
jgi:hypothetical protein